MANEVRVILADASEEFRILLKDTIEETGEFCVVGSTGDGERLVQMALELKPQLVIMDLVLPALSTSITFGVPAVIGVYWIYQNVLNVVQTVIVAKIMPIPACSEEDIRAAEKQLAGKGGKKKKAELDPNRPKPRSLHYIDEEDELPPAVKDEKEAEDLIIKGFLA